jgi:hypothetical protein
MVHADLICVPQLMSGEQALAAPIGGSARVLLELSPLGVVAVYQRCPVLSAGQRGSPDVQPHDGPWLEHRPASQGGERVEGRDPRDRVASVVETRAPHAHAAAPGMTARMPPAMPLLAGRPTR